MASPKDIHSWDDFTKFYHHLTHHVVPGPNSASYAIPCILLPTALLIPSSLLSHTQLALLFFPAICASQLHAILVGGLDVIGVNILLWSFVLLVLRDPRRTHRRVKIKAVEEGGEDVVVEEPYPERFEKRVPWVLTLLVSLRLAGWRIGEDKHDRTQPPVGTSRRAFLKIAVATVVQGYIVMDATSCYVQTDPYFHESGTRISQPFPPPLSNMPTAVVFIRTLPPRLVRTAILAAQAHGMVHSMFLLPTIPAVALNAMGLLPAKWSPHTWPSFFGPFASVWKRGMRGLWGDWWHSMNRQISATPGTELAKALGIRTHKTLAYMVLAVSAFFLSGVIHLGMIPPEPKSEIMSAMAMRMYIGGFFWAQILAFGIELAVMKLLSRYRRSATSWWGSRILVLLWVAFWLSLTLPLLVVPFREIGYWHYHAVPISPFRGLTGGGWITW